MLFHPLVRSWKVDTTPYTEDYDYRDPLALFPFTLDHIVKV